VEKLGAITALQKRGNTYTIGRKDLSKMTYGDVLFRLLWGSESDNFLSKMRPMTADELDMCVTLYCMFEAKVISRGLATMTSEEFDTMIDDDSRPCGSHTKQLVIKNCVVERDAKCFGWGQPVSPQIFGYDSYSYRYFEQLHISNGTEDINGPYNFKDKFVRKVVLHNPLASLNDEMKYITNVNVLEHVYMAAFSLRSYVDNDTLHYIPYECTIVYYGEILDTDIIPMSYRHPSGHPTNWQPWKDGGYLIKKTFIGKECTQQLVDYITDNFKHKRLMLLSHTLKDDINFLIRNSTFKLWSAVQKTVSTMSVANGEIEHSTKGLSRMPLLFLNTNEFIVMPVRDFSSTFELGDYEEELNPAMLYNADTLVDGKVKVDAAIPFFDDASKFATFARRIRNSGQFGGRIYDSATDTFDLYYYSLYYAERDCEVLLKGFLTYRMEMYMMPYRDPNSKEIK
jgi:hypothetical protein